jgi:hypothetical protein
MKELPLPDCRGEILRFVSANSTVKSWNRRERKQTEFAEHSRPEPGFVAAGSFLK